MYLNTKHRHPLRLDTACLFKYMEPSILLSTRTAPLKIHTLTLPSYNNNPPLVVILNLPERQPPQTEVFHPLLTY
jgi:hypothetical protein